MTGIGSGKILNYDLTEAANIARQVNERVAGIIQIYPAARISCVKPSGTTSCVLGTSSGIHAWHDEFYLRTVRFNRSEDISKYLEQNHPEIVELDVLRPHDTICVRIPIQAPKGSILRSETAIDTLERVKKFAKEWIQPGHLNGDNSHNVSATISIDKNRVYNYNITPVEDAIKVDEWEMVGDWMWYNQNYYNGLSVLPFDGGSYTQAPFESISETEYNQRIKTLSQVDLTKIIEEDDNVSFGQVQACAGGKCEL